MRVNFDFLARFATISTINSLPSAVHNSPTPTYSFSKVIFSHPYTLHIMPLPSSTYVFEIPELASLITSFLLQKDILHLMQTSRLMHATMEPWFYRNLKTVYKVGRHNLYQSPDALNALTRNIHHTRSWTSDLFHLVFFFYASAVTPILKVHEDKEEEEVKEKGEGRLEQGSDTSLSHAQSQPLPSPSTPNTLTTVTTSTTTPTTAAAAKETFLVKYSPRMNSCLAAPLPPMVHLTKLDIDPTFKASFFATPISPSFIYPYITIPHLCATLRRSPHLRELNIRSFLFGDPKCTRAFISTLWSLTHLTHLRLYVDTYKGFQESGLLAFFSCPPSVRCLVIERDDNTRRYDTTEKTSDNIRDIALLLDEIRARGATKPLVYLQEFHFWDVSMTTTTEELYSIFAHCPNVETLRLRWRCVGDNPDGTKIAKMCPKLRSISYGCNTMANDGEDWSYVLALTLPEHKLECFHHTDFSVSIDADLVERALVRHCQSLREISIQTRVPSKTIGKFLELCEALEILDVLRSTLDLEDAIAAPWASSSMMELSLDIDTGVKRKLFYLRPPPSRRSPREKQLLGRLEILYHQIGKQTNLRTLHLGQMGGRDYNKRDTGKYIQPFAAMLRLSDKKDGIVPGYLELLGGLKKLRKITGSVGPETKDYRMAIDAEEVEWIAEHWPEFTYADFYPQLLFPRDRVRFSKRGSGMIVRNF
jgi:hypothetical protein